MIPTEVKEKKQNSTSNLTQSIGNEVDCVNTLNSLSVDLAVNIHRETNWISDNWIEWKKRWLIYLEKTTIKLMLWPLQKIILKTGWI